MNTAKSRLTKSFNYDIIQLWKHAATQKTFEGADMVCSSGSIPDSLRFPPMRGVSSFFGVSLKGRAAGFGPAYVGSIPAAPVEVNMSKDDFGEIYGLDRMYEAEALIGSSCVFSDDYDEIKDRPDELPMNELIDVDMFGFVSDCGDHQFRFIREVKPFAYVPFNNVDEFMTEFGGHFIHKTASSNFYWLKPVGIDQMNDKVYIPTEGWVNLFDLALKWVDEKGRHCGLRKLL